MNSGGKETRLPGARAVLILLVAVNLLIYIDRYVLVAVVDDIKNTFFGSGSNGQEAATLQTIQNWTQAHFGFKPELAFIGVLGMAFMVVYMIGAPLCGLLAGRLPRWKVIGGAVILWTLASGVSGLAPTFLVLLLSRCFIGAGQAAYGPVAPTLISDLFPVEKRGKALAFFNMAIPVGGALGFALGGAVLTLHLGDVGARWFGIHQESWRWAFYLVVPPGLLLGIWCFFMREPPRGHSDLASGVVMGKARWADYKKLFRTPSYVLCTLGMTAMTFAIGGIAFWMPYYLAQRPGAPDAGKVSLYFGGIVCLSGLTGTLCGSVLGDKLRKRFPGSYFLVSGAAMLLGFPLMLVMLRTPFPWVWLLVFVTCFCLFFNTGPTYTILANVTHPSIRAMAFALNIFFMHTFGDVISPVIIGIFSDRYDMNHALMIVSAMFLVAAVAWFCGVRHLERDTKRATQPLSTAA